MSHVFRSIVGPKGQITIPKELRERFHMREGEEVVILPGDRGIIVKHPTKSLRGRLRGILDTEGIDKDIKELRAQWRL